MSADNDSQHDDRWYAALDRYIWEKRSRTTNKKYREYVLAHARKLFGDEVPKSVSAQHLSLLDLANMLKYQSMCREIGEKPQVEYVEENIAACLAGNPDALKGEVGRLKQMLVSSYDTDPIEHDTWADEEVEQALKEAGKPKRSNKRRGRRSPISDRIFDLIRAGHDDQTVYDMVLKEFEGQNLPAYLKSIKGVVAKRKYLKKIGEI